jgi:hypothetical protein
MQVMVPLQYRGWERELVKDELAMVAQSKLGLRSIAETRSSQNTTATSAQKNKNESEHEVAKKKKGSWAADGPQMDADGWSRFRGAVPLRVFWKGTFIKGVRPTDSLLSLFPFS